MNRARVAAALRELADAIEADGVSHFARCRAAQSFRSAR